MSEALKPSYYLFENVSGQFITDDIKEAENWKKYGDPMTELYTKSQLDAQSAYIEELKEAFKQYQATGFEEIFENAMAKSPTTSLEQVRMQAKIEALKDYDACLSSFPMTVEEYIANNLKEKG